MNRLLARISVLQRAIFLAFTFLISPMGLLLAAIWLLGKVQSLKFCEKWLRKNLFIILAEKLQK